MGYRYTPSGKKRLLVITRVAMERSRDGYGMPIGISSITPGTLLTLPKVLHIHTLPDATEIPFRHPSELVRIYFGRSDPNDSTHFTIEYDGDGTHGILDGWLLNDESVRLVYRNGPATLNNAPRTVVPRGRLEDIWLPDQ